MSLYDHRYPTSSETSKSRRYLWSLILCIAITFLFRVYLIHTAADDDYNAHTHKSSAKHFTPPPFHSYGTPKLKKNEHALNAPPTSSSAPSTGHVKLEIVHDQLVPHLDLEKVPGHEEKHPAEDTGEDDVPTRDGKSGHYLELDSEHHHLGMKGERMKSFFKVKQRNSRKPFHTPEHVSRRKRMFDDIDDPEDKNEKRRKKLREEMQWAWNSYKAHAWGYDELHSVTKRPRSWIDGTKGFAMTIFDSLDTLYLMNLTKEFHDGVDYLYTKFDLYINAGCSTFEATIRLLGGSLSAYELSNDIRLLRIAEKVGWILIAGLETSNGMLRDHVNFKTRQATSMGWLNGNNLVSELGSLQLEFRTLSYHLKDPIFDLRVTHLMSILKSGCENQGYVCPTMFNENSGKPASRGFTLGGMADSYFEYIVKQYVLTGGVEEELEKMATTMLETIDTQMIVEKRIPQRNHDRGHDADNVLPAKDDETGTWSVTYPAVWNGMHVDHRNKRRLSTNSLEHLTCFTGGMFALGALNMKNLPEDTRQNYAQIGHDITETCANMYFSQNTGLAPEEVSLDEGAGFHFSKNEYRLRPETVESIFYMWRITRDEMYREWAWTIFDSMMRFCRMPWGGYSGILDINMVKEPDFDEIIEKHETSMHWDDLQQSYFMSETMKYLYLTFADTSLADLEDWVFNTESHPMRIRQRDPREVWYDWKKKHNGKPRWTAPRMRDVKPFYPELSGDYKS